jgi:hypothetical protein
MIEYDVGLLVVRLNHLERLENELTGAFRYPGGMGECFFPKDPNEKLSERARQTIWAHFGPMSDEMKPLGFDAARLEIQYIWNNAHIWSAKEIAVAIKGLRWKVEQELRSCMFYFVDEQDKILIKATDPFELQSSFPSALKEFGDAARCISFEQGTAAVFHCMRALESGIKALATEVGKVYDIQQWNIILNEIESEIGLMRRNGIPGLSKLEKDSKLEFLSRAAIEIGYFKDGWRNYVSHNKKPYDVLEAKSIYNHSGSFMKVLSERLSE